MNKLRISQWTDPRIACDGWVFRGLEATSLLNCLRRIYRREEAKPQDTRNIATGSHSADSENSLDRTLKISIEEFFYARSSSQKVG